MSCCQALHGSTFHSRGKESSGRGVKGELVKCCMHSLYALWKGRSRDGWNGPGVGVLAKRVLLQ